MSKFCIKPLTVAHISVTTLISDSFHILDHNISVALPLISAI